MPGTERVFDAIVVGVGAMGSATVYHLAKRHSSVLGVERFDIPHQMGSSHGVTRIIRMAYFEHPSYVPLLHRSYQLWRALEGEAAEDLLHVTGSIDVGRPGSSVLDGSITSCLTHGLSHRVLDAQDLHRRFPGIDVPGDFRAVLQPDGGFLMSERCIVAHCTAALRLGAEIHGRERVVQWRALDDSVEIQTDRARYRAKHLVLTAGAWIGKLFPSIAQLAVPERQVLGWFQPTDPALFAPERFPVFNFTADEGHFYGFPIFGVPGFKIGLYHHLGERIDPDVLDRSVVRTDDEAILRDVVKRYFPKANGPTLALKTCMFTNTPDEHFIIDRHPTYPQIHVAAGFSGHGFKFASVVGEILADLVTQGDTRHDISRFTLGRFTVV